VSDGDQGAVGPGHPWLRRVPLEHGELLAQDEDLSISLVVSDRVRSTIQPMRFANI
jgi:hypothetical protein